MKPFLALVFAAALAAAGALFGACYTSPNAVSGASVTLSPDLDNGVSLPPGAPLIVVPSESGSAARLAAAMPGSPPRPSWTATTSRRRR